MFIGSRTYVHGRFHIGSSPNEPMFIFLDGYYVNLEQKVDDYNAKWKNLGEESCHFTFFLVFCLFGKKKH